MSDDDDPDATRASEEPGRIAKAQAAFTAELPYDEATIIGRLGDYDLLSELGRGGMGVVYRAFSRRLHRMCALKLLLVDNNTTEAQLLRFQYEARLAARLDHPNIVKVFDSGEEGGRFWFVMEVVEGCSLTDLIAEGSQDAVRRGVAALAKTARALHFAHRSGVIHRDVKPDNILIDQAGEPHITDFGIAKDLAAEAHLTREGATVGTPHYMPPEQASVEGTVGPLSDVYALGATLYHLVCGRVPFPGDASILVLFDVVGKEPEAPRVVAARERGVELDPDLETICLRAIEKEALRRYSSALALAEDLEAWLDDRPIQARPVGRTERVRKLLRKNRGAFVASTLVGAVMLLMVLAFGTVVGLTFQATSDSLLAVDRRAALDQAETLERAIRLNMLRGRPDVVRDLMHQLRQDQTLNTVQVVRVDRSYAYTDLSTRRAVAERLDDRRVVDWARREFPELLPSIEMLRQTAFPRIDDSPDEPNERFPMSEADWASFLARDETRVEMTVGYPKRPVLRVMTPIANGGACQICHGSANEDGAVENNVRAVLVIDRDQTAVRERIAANRRTTLSIGAMTTIVFLALMALFARVFGIGLPPRRFGAPPPEPPVS